MTSPNPQAQRAMAAGYVKDALEKLEHAHQHELVADDNRALHDELGRLIDQLKALRQKLSG
jgi:hypothetical protein